VASKEASRYGRRRGAGLAWALVLVVGGALALASALGGCDQPRVTCVTGRGDFAAKYTLVSGNGPCAMMKGDTIGVQSYNSAQDDHPNLKDVSVALRTASLGVLVQHAEDNGLGDPNMAHVPYAFGRFSASEPGPDDFCTVPTLAPAEQDLPTVPEQPPSADGGSPGAPEQPATSIAYSWSNLRVYVTAAATGTQFAGDVTYTRDGCTASYHVVAVYPAVPCADANGKPSDVFCSPEANPDAGLATGSGINPDFPVACDPDLLMCVLTKEPPALR
jgi:hypothetical protein